MSTTEIIHARDFSTSTADHFRDRWTVGKLRHVIAALDELDDRTVIAQVSSTGFCVVGILQRAYDGGATKGPRVTIQSEHNATNYRLDELGPIVLMPSPALTPGAKWRAIELHRKEGSAAIRRAIAEHGQHEGRYWGKWTSVATADGVYVTYEPHTGNPALADQAGARGSWEYRTTDLLATT